MSKQESNRQLEETAEEKSSEQSKTDKSDNVKVKNSFNSQAFLKSAPTQPGVYRMFDKNGTILYVGKAKHLKKRLSSYFQKNLNSVKTQALVKQIASIDTTVTNTEAEALILEHNLIKQFRPKFNVLMRDDKSYPYIVLTPHEYPQLKMFRGRKKRSGRVFGPFPSASAVKESLNLMQKLFRVRQCEDSYFSNRSRPCLQYQINRCTAPCVNKITYENYQRDVRLVEMFFKRQNQQVIDELGEQMQQYSADLQFEEAARVRDLIIQLQKVTQKQVISSGQANVDVLGVAVEQGKSCIHCLSVRDGRIIASDNFYPNQSKDSSKEEVLEAFLSHKYFQAEIVPQEIIVPIENYSNESFVDAVEQLHSIKVQLKSKVKEQRAAWLKLAKQNASLALSSKLSSESVMLERARSLQELLLLDDLPKRVECFDISHTMGEETVASCVVFNARGPLKSDYRKFNIKGITGGDDYAAMKQALTRRYARIKKGEVELPDVLIIDGGKGQLSQAIAVLSELDLPEFAVLGISKGPTRKAGWEFLHLPGDEEPIDLDGDSPALHFIQYVRDEAHRFAITGHRKKRDKKRATSVLQDIPGIGDKRRRDLLTFFGGMQELLAAGIDDITQVKGINKPLAEKIHSYLHDAS